MKTKRVVMTLWLVALSAACEPSSDVPCTEDDQDPSCALEVEADSQSEALGLHELFFEVRASEAPRRAGTVTATALNRLAYCHGSTCIALRGASISLRAVPAEGILFSRWRGCSDSTNSTLALTRIHENLRCTAEFAARDAASFEGLGDLPGGDIASYAADLSSDGSIVVGYSRGADGDEAFRWTEPQGLRGLGGNQSRAEDVSPDGSLVVGSIAKAELQLGRAGVRWALEGTSMSILGPTLPSDGPPPLFLVVNGTDARNSGLVYGSCIQYGAYGEYVTCSIDSSDTVTYLGPVMSIIDAADDSQTLAGTRLVGRGEAPSYASVAIFGGMQLGYPADAPCLVPHRCESAARAFSDDRSIVVGTSRIPPPGPLGAPEEPLLSSAWRYDASSGMVRLPDLAEGEQASGALALSADGRVIAGFGSDAQGRQAVLWRDGVPYRLDAWIPNIGGSIPDGWRLLEITAMTPDGRVYVGNALNPAGQPEAFRVVLAQRPW